MILIRRVLARRYRGSGFAARPAGMERNGLESSHPEIKPGHRPALRQFDGTIDKLASEIGQAQQARRFRAPAGSYVGAPAVEFGLVQVVRDFEDHGNLCGRARERGEISSREMPVSSTRSSTPNIPRTLPSALNKVRRATAVPCRWRLPADWRPPPDRDHWSRKLLSPAAHG